MTAISEKNPLKDIRVVILDLDGTMIDSVPDLDVALNGMLKELTLPPGRSSLDTDVCRTRYAKSRQEHPFGSS